MLTLNRAKTIGQKLALISKIRPDYFAPEVMFSGSWNQTILQGGVTQSSSDTFLALLESLNNKGLGDCLSVSLISSLYCGLS